ncbi:MAG TPA: hypothetical protein VK938_04730 [Methylophilaceae bacterium]|jgi:predicted MFS family arabinose efflux permease|uniref:hypothetical protein n=1 Tax=Ideonella sp. TaxID=1929293 RepID=UPI002B5EA8BC|nr:hypothetical protein [Methylophilaceae bacterium]
MTETMPAGLLPQIGQGLALAGQLVTLYALGSVTFGGAPTLLQTALADTAGDGADVVQSMLVTVFNLAVAGGGGGGVMLERFGPASFPWALAMLALFGLSVVWSAKAHGFKPGHRVATA